MGSAFNPETCCEYTGQALWQFPASAALIGYWRADGELRAVRLMTPEELAWIAANPVQHQAQSASFNAWLAATRKDI